MNSGETLALGLLAIAMVFGAAFAPPASAAACYDVEEDRYILAQHVVLDAEGCVPYTAQ